MISKLDLLIIDIDNTFIPHRTVDAGYRLFLKNFSQLYGKKLENGEYYTTSRAWSAAFRITAKEFLHLRLKKAPLTRLMMLTIAGFHLNLLYVFRGVINRFIRRMGSERIIRTWVKVVLNSRVKKDELYPGKDLIERSTDKRVLAIYEKIRKENPGMKVIAISQNFMIDKDPIKEILTIDELHSNRFVYNKEGLITGCRVSVQNGHDKRRIAERMVKKYKAKSIGVVVEDYDDLELLEMKNIALVMCSRKKQRFIRNKSVSIIYLE